MASIKLCEDVSEALRSMLALIVIGHAIVAMLGFGKAVEVKAEEGVREDARRSEVGENGVNGHGSD